MSNKQSVLTYIQQYGSCNTSHMINNVKPQLNIKEIENALKTLKENRLLDEKDGIWGEPKSSFTAILSSRLWNGALLT